MAPLRPLRTLPKRATGNFRSRVLRKACNSLSSDTAQFCTLLSSWAVSTTRQISRVEQVELCRRITAWVTLEDDFDSLREAAHEFVASLRVELLDFGELRAIARLLGTVGAFTPSQILVEKAARSSVARQPTDERQAREFLQAAIYLGEFDRDLLTRTLHLIKSKEERRIFSFYSSLIDGEKSRPLGAVFYGPGPVSDQQTASFQECPIARVLMPGVTDWTNDSDKAEGRTEFVYANGQTVEWLSTLEPSTLTEILNPNVHLKVKPNQNWSPARPNTSTFLDVRALYFSGNPNMGPNAILDLLASFSGTHVYVLGNNFYQSDVGYRPDSRRNFLSQGGGSDKFGSTGRSFERCASMASHDQPSNRAILANLLKHGWLSGDDLFLTSMTKATPDFTGHLETHYGVHRR